MKKIGFIDYYLDEWHADNYPEWIEIATDGKMKVTCAYGKKDSPNGISNATWCKKRGIQLLSTIEEVVDNSDYLIILSPDHSELHEELAWIPLQSGKPTFIDKTFAQNRKTALRLFERAERYSTPLYSCSALRFATEYIQAEREGIDRICSVGPGMYGNYAIHQIEPIVSLISSSPKRVMYIGTSKSPALLIDFSNGSQATINHFSGDCPFNMVINYEAGHSLVVKPESDFFSLFIKDLVRFFETGESSVNAVETIDIITIIEYGLLASKRPFKWVELPTR